MRELRRAEAVTRTISVTGPPAGSRRKISFSSSNAALSATRFLFLFLIRPASMEIPMCLRASLVLSETNAGAGSIRMTAYGPSSWCEPNTRGVRASKRASRFSSAMIQEAVQEIVHSRSSRMNWRNRLITSAAKVTPRTSGGSSDDLLTKVLGNFSRELF